MIIVEKPKIGLLGIMHGLYDEKQPEITEKQEKWARSVASSLSSIADVDFPRAAKSRAEIEMIISGFNSRGYDGVMIVMLLYSPGFRLVRALEQNRLPIMLANIQPLSTVTDDWDWSRLTTNQGIHGAQDTANVLLQGGMVSTVVTEDWQSETFRRFFEDWVRAARTRSVLKKMRIALFGRMKGMGDIVGDDGVFLRKIGPEVNHEGLGQIYRRMLEVTETEIAAQIAEDRQNFDFDPNLPEKNYHYAVKLQLALEKFLRHNRYDGFSVHFDAFKEDGRFEQINLLAASNLMAKGYAYANEGDSHTAALVGATHALVGNGHFTEMYSLDYARDSALMSHMGEGNWKIARKDRRIKLIDRELEIGGLSNPPTLVFSAQPGPSTLTSLVSLDGRGYRLVVCEGDILDTPELTSIPMPYFHFRPRSGIRAAMDKWLLAGGGHHQSLNLYHHCRRWRMLASILGIECIEV